MLWIRMAPAVVILGGLHNPGVVPYEGDTFPEQVGWERLGTFDADRWCEGGWFFQEVDLGVWEPPPGGEQDAYTRGLGHFAGEPRFFIEWTMATNGDRSEIPGAAPAVLVAGGRTGVKYHFTVATDQARLIRDNALPIVFVDLNPRTAHLYRLELHSDDLYVWYIDGEVVDFGVPEGRYPTDYSNNLKWGAFSWYLQSTTRWDYIRYGVIPVDGTGDYDSDEDVDGRDFYFFHECLTNRRVGINGGPDNDAGPGCRFADFDADADVDLQDIAAFQQSFTGSH